MLIVTSVVLGLVSGAYRDAAPDDGYCNYGGTVSGTESDLKCTCREGYSGDRCEKFVCTSNRDCYNNGICYRSNSENGDYCVCPLGFTGADCYVRSCGEPYFDAVLREYIYCNGGGECNIASPNRMHNYYKSECTCRKGFGGEACKEFSCKIEGNSSSGTFECPSFPGSQTSGMLSEHKTTCKLESSDPNAPTSTTNQYYCDGCPFYATGRDCGILYCGAKINGNEVTMCSGNGRCRAERQLHAACICNKNFMGEICNISRCEMTDNDKTCGFHGTCQKEEDDSLNTCKCEDNYIGDTCNICAIPFIETSYYQLKKGDNGAVIVGDDIKACTHPACLYDGTVCNNAGTCVLFSRQWDCECQTGFAYYDGTCVPTDKSCGSTRRICGGFGDCVFGFDNGTRVASWACVCHEGYRLDSSKKNCVIRSCFEDDPTYPCNNHGKCNSEKTQCTCEDGYTGVNCENCPPGFRYGEDFYSDTCVPVHCGADGYCDGLGSCAFSMPHQAYLCECSDGFVTDSTTGSCIRCQLPNCAYCGTDTTCMECSLGYYLQMDGKCAKCDRACTTCKGPGKKDCIVCAPGTVRADATRPSSGCSPECVVNENDCVSCDAVVLGSRYCSQCEDGMYPLEGVCTNFNNSQRYFYPPCLSAKNGTCRRCSVGYLLFEGGCYLEEQVPGNVICRQYDENGECLACGTGFFQDSGSCSICPENCASCTSKTSCDNCMTGYFLQGSQCVGCHSTCLRCKGPEENECSSCASGYFAQFLMNGSPSGTCRPCSDAVDVNGIKGRRGCSECMIDFKTDPPSFLCLDPVKKGLSGGAIAAIVIVVLVVVGGIAGFCIYWFLFRNKTKTGGKRLRSRTADDTDYASLMNTDDSGTFI